MANATGCRCSLQLQPPHPHGGCVHHWLGIPETWGPQQQMRRVVAGYTPLTNPKNWIWKIVIVGNLPLVGVHNNFLRGCYTQMLHGAGIYTYITGWFVGRMLVNIPYMEHMGYGVMVSWCTFRRQVTLLRLPRWLWSFPVGLWNFPDGLCNLDCETCQSDC